MKRVLAVFAVMLAAGVGAGPVVIDHYRYAAVGGGDGITVTELTQGSETTTEPSLTAAITPTANAQVLVTIVYAVEGGGATHASDAMVVSGCSLTWTEVGHAFYDVAHSGRRGMFVFRGAGASPTSGALTLDFTSGGGSVWTEHMWSVDEVTGADGSTPVSNVATNQTGIAGNTSLTVTVGGTVDAGDFVFCAWGIEGSSVSATLESGITSLTNLGGGTDARTVVAGYDGTPTIDQTPSLSWTGTNAAAGIAFIIEKAP